MSVDSRTTGKHLGSRSTTRSIIEHMDTPEDPDAAARLAAILATAGTADDVFPPGYLQALREDWANY